MTKAKLDIKVEEEAIKYADSLEYGIPSFSDENGYTWWQVEQAYEKGALNFAELREKRIEELEKENKELKTVKIPQLERKIASIRGAHSVDCKKLNAKIEQCERQKELIKNLKEDVQNKDLALEDYTKWSESQKKKTDEQLSKAKEIIRKYYEYNPDCEYFYEDIDKEAEQFLNEVSE